MIILEDGYDVLRGIGEVECWIREGPDEVVRGVGGVCQELIGELYNGVRYCMMCRW